MFGRKQDFDANVSVFQSEVQAMAGEAQRFPTLRPEGIYMALSHTATCQLSGWRLVRGRKPSTLGQTLSRMFASSIIGRVD